MTFFFFNDTATTEIYTLSLHDALPIYPITEAVTGVDLVHWQIRIARGERLDIDAERAITPRGHALECRVYAEEDRKSTRLNSSHANISYAVFCLKKKITLSAFRTRTSA